MRLFVAIEISDAMRQRIAGLTDELRARLGRAVSAVAWVPPERLHLTVQFIGQVDVTTAGVIRRSFETPYDVAPFVLQIGGLGVFPPAGRPRVIWLGVQRGREGAARVHAETARRLAGLGVPRDARPFSPHLTIGRIRDGRGTRLRHDAAAPPAAAGRCTIDHVALFESRLSPRGPTYLPLVRAPFVRGE